MENLKHNRQFLLTKIACDLPGWNHRLIVGYHLYAHPNLEMTHVSIEGIEIVLLGFFFDYRYPEYTNRDILNALASSCKTFDEVLHVTDELSGRFVLIYRSPHDLKLFHDVCGQREVFYDSTFSAIGSQPMLIEKVIAGQEITDSDAIDFFRSEVFQKHKLYIGDRTHRMNIRRLLPNHFVDLHSGSVHRFFPVAPGSHGRRKDVVKRTITMLRGYMKSAALRYPLDLGVTAGYDSRILFLVSLDLPCSRFVEKRKRQDNPIDIKYALELGSKHQRPVEVREINLEYTDEAREIHLASVDFPKAPQISILQSDKLIISGHVSEVARNYFSYRPGVRSLKNITGADLARMYYYEGNPYAIRIYNEWIDKNRALFKRTGYNYLDFFYWEERMANWASKLKTEIALRSEIYPPFSSRALVTMLLSVHKRHRDKYRTRLYDDIIQNLSPIAMQIPINPIERNEKRHVLKRWGLLKFDQKYGLVSKILRHLPF